MRMRLVLALLVWTASACAWAQSAPAPDFQSAIQPVLQGSCVTCHSGEKAAGKLRLETAELMARGGTGGAAVIPGKSAESPLYTRVITADRSLHMPPTGESLPAAKAALIKAWIDGGAPGFGVAPAAAAAGPGKPEYARHIQPILAANCYACHSGSQPKGQLRLDSRSLALKGGLSGPVIIPGNSKASRLVHRVEGSGGEQRMPLKATPLTAAEIATLARWIDQGAEWPGAETEAAGIRKHWAYVKPVKAPAPQVKGAALVRNPIDAFLLARLEKEGLSFSPEASKEKLLRRVSLDLTGLPPTIAELDAYLQDAQPGAYERAVDRLLASPHYGERWARPWLDMARFADTNGYEKDRRRSIWKYRDWVINAFNRDLPFDKFTIEQLAGDMLPNATEEQKIATGFHRNTMFNEEGGVDREETHFEVLVDRVNTTGTVWLGATIGCTQCHNHKYDPFTQKEYYQLMAFFSNSRREIKEYGDTSSKYLESTLEMPTGAQETKRKELTGQISALEAKLKTQTPALSAEQAKWESEVSAAAAKWKTLEPANLRASSGSVLGRSEAGAILASGANPRSEIFSIDAPSPLTTVTALRIEALPHASLPRGGPGRDPYGNFFVSEIGLEVIGGDAKALPFGNRKADNTTVPAGRKSEFVWAVDASQEDKRMPRQFVLQLQSPLKLAPGSNLRITINQQSDYLGAALGHFRLSVTDSADPLRIVEISHSLRPLLAIAAAKRTPEQLAKLSDYYRTIAPPLEEARTQLRSLRKDLEGLGIVNTLILEEASGWDRPNDNIRIRGSFMSKGEKVYANVPAALGRFSDSQMPNRLGLARWLASRENPVTARVVVNRMWEQYFGKGIVETSEDLGSQGERPVHPELLDWLAVELMDRNWSMKAIHKLIVTSTAYRQSAAVTPELLAKDPYNRLIGRGPRFRVEAEMVRDVSLAASGLLSRKVGGPSVFPPQPSNVWDIPYSDDSWQESQGEDRYRRALYTFARRTAPYPAMLNFDSTSREFCTVRRVRTNTPLQALTTLNDTAFFEMAQALASRMEREGGATEAERLAYGFRLVTARTAKPEEIARLQGWLAGERKRFAAAPAEAKKVAGANAQGDAASRAAWTLAANVLLNLDEALTKE